MARPSATIQMQIPLMILETGPGSPMERPSATTQMHTPLMILKIGPGSLVLRPSSASSPKVLPEGCDADSNTNELCKFY
jgi:hypothetical protein